MENPDPRSVLRRRLSSTVPGAAAEPPPPPFPAESTPPANRYSSRRASGGDARAEHQAFSSAPADPRGFILRGLTPPARSATFNKVPPSTDRPEGKGKGAPVDSTVQPAPLGDGKFLPVPAVIQPEDPPLRTWSDILYEEKEMDGIVMKSRLYKHAEWVAVIGLSLDVNANLLLNEFQTCGEILDFIRGPSNSDWMYILFKHLASARRALRKNGMRIFNVPITVMHVDMDESMLLFKIVGDPLVPKLTTKESEDALLELYSKLGPNHPFNNANNTTTTLNKISTTAQSETSTAQSETSVASKVGLILLILLILILILDCGCYCFLVRFFEINLLVDRVE